MGVALFDRAKRKGAVLELLPATVWVASDEYLNPYATAPPGSLLTPMVTLYTYDTLDNLTCVEQHGTATGQTGCSSAQPTSPAQFPMSLISLVLDNIS